MTDTLTEQQYDLLLDARDLESPVVVDEPDLQAAKEALAWAVAEARQIDLESAEDLPLAVLANQIQTDIDSDDGPGVAEALRNAAQHPETGGADEDELDTSDGDSDSLSGDDRQRLKRLVEKRQVMTGRTPEYVSELEERICDIAGVDEVDAALEKAGLDDDSLTV